MWGLYVRLDPPAWSFLNGLLNHVVKQLNVEEALKSPILVAQKAAAPKTGVEFCQGSNGTIRISLATSYNVWQHREVFGLPIHLLTPHSQSRVWRQGRCLKIMENLSHADPTHQP